MVSLIQKGNLILNSQSYENSINRNFNENSFEFWIFYLINAFFIIGLLLSPGTHYLFNICTVGYAAIILGISRRKVSNKRDFIANEIWLILSGIFFLELGWIIIQIFLPFIENPSSGFLVYWMIIIPLFLFSISLGTFFAVLIIGNWLMIPMLQNLENQNHFNLTALRQELSQYIQIFDNDIRIRFFLGVNILI
jgi:hypothetical protein